MTSSAASSAKLRLDADLSRDRRHRLGDGGHTRTRSEDFDYDSMARQRPGRSARLHPRPRRKRSLTRGVVTYPAARHRTQPARARVSTCSPSRSGAQAMLEAERTAWPTAQRAGWSCAQEDDADASPGFLIYMPVFEAAPEGRAPQGLHLQPVQRVGFPQSRRSSPKTPRATTSGCYDGPGGKSNLLACAGQGRCRRARP